MSPAERAAFERFFDTAAAIRARLNRENTQTRAA
jgi:hypothetical protein